MKKNVDVLLLGSYSTGYAVVVHPWHVEVSKNREDCIAWTCNQPVKIKLPHPKHFDGYTEYPNAAVKAKTGKVIGPPGQVDYRYSIKIKGEQNNWVIIDPDYRINP